MQVAKALEKVEKEKTCGEATGSYWKPWLRENSLSSNNYLTICSFLQGDVGNQGNLNAFCFLHFFHDLRFKKEKIRIIESSHGTINSPNKHFTDNLYYFKGFIIHGQERLVSDHTLIIQIGQFQVNSILNWAPRLKGMKQNIQTET